MDKDKFAPGEPCWADTATDLAKAVPFYTALFGWEVEDLGPTAGNYHLASLRGRLVAGLGAQMNPVRPCGRPTSAPMTRPARSRGCASTAGPSSPT